MLDAGAAVAAVSGALARIDVNTPAPTAGGSVPLSGSSSLASLGASITGYAWRLVSSDPGVVTGFAGATNAATATLNPAAAGRFTVELTVTDSSGASNVAQTTVTVAAAGTAPPASGGGSSGGGSGGGGAVSVGWLAGLALAVALLSALRRRA